ncbi:zinc-ribbon domain-containing protein [Sulfobacillus harzensis]|uniref:Zinc-ribbon domain-containing protein n=1 Tax=Sulfobacillus harzensis TaxID=2729629 RepID=A0A7Y0L4T1_9FIRM|nr:zinc-ribbon domain-containing protein [Sulfobacillus harzensis]NMP22972.1 zinc-ribbon domain-containing protein [Sulfobacillus harzensis]
MFCRSCGENIPVDSVFCPNCGKNLLEVAERRVPPEAETETDPILEEEEPTIFRFRRRRTHEAPIDEPDETPADLSADDDEAPQRSFDWHQFSARVSLTRLFWVVGLIFSAVGFVVGLAGNIRSALAWILFGLVLVVAAPKAPEASQQNANAADDAAESPTEHAETLNEEMRD